MTSNDSSSRNQAQSVQGPNRKHLVLMVLITAISLVGAYVLVKWAGGGGIAFGTTNQGQFVDPPRAAQDYQFTSPDGTGLQDPLALWQVWVVFDGGCGGECEQALHLLRQMHVLLNRDAARVRRVLIGQPSGDATAAELVRAGSTYPKLVRWQTGNFDQGPGIFIVDPHGNLVLRYRFDQAGEPVFEDLRRLLKLSQIG